MDNGIELDPTPGRGTPESAAWFREQLDELGLGQTALARFMQRHGDDRQESSIRRTIARMATGHARVSGEMRVLLALMRQRRGEVQEQEQAAE